MEDYAPLYSEELCRWSQRHRTVETKSQAGEAAFLSIILKSIHESARIDGLHVEQSEDTEDVKVQVEMKTSDEVLAGIRAMPTGEIIDVIQAVRKAAREHVNGNGKSNDNRIAKSPDADQV